MLKQSPARARKLSAAILSYLMLAGQVAPLALASSPSRAALPAQTSESAPLSSITYSQRRAPAPVPPVGGGTNVSAVPVISATKVDSFPDPNSDGKADPGETITYTVTIQNTGTADATGVQFNDTIDANITLVAGQTTAQPITAPDTYNVIGNVGIQPERRYFRYSNGAASAAKDLLL